jgi:type III secretion protein D
MNAPSSPMMTSQLILRVIGGRQAGAEYRLAHGITASIGHGFQHDIVLRVPAARDCSLRLDVEGAMATLHVVAGAVLLLGRPVAAGQAAQLPFYVPVTVGDASFAIGDPASDRWQEATDLSQARMTPDHNVTGDGNSSDPLVPMSDGPKDGIAEQMNGAMQIVAQRLAPVSAALAIDRRWPVYAVIAATVLLALLLFNPLSNWVGQQYFGAAAAQTMLQKSGFADLDVSETADGNLLIKGLVRNDAQLTRLRGLVSEQRPGAIFDVTTMDGLASGVTDMLVAQGIDAEARPGRGKTLIIASEYLPGDRQTELAAQIRKDTPVLSRIVFNIDPERGEPMLQYFFSSDKYGIASFVDGDPSYISTADGTRWFKGGAVPTGHVITEIGNGRVRFERDGNIEELTFGAPVTAPEGDDNAAPAEGAAPEITNKTREVSTSERKTK